MSAAGKVLVVVGGVAVTTASLWWWLKEHPVIPPPPTCSDYHTESECAAHGCYWYSGSCHVAPEPPPEFHYDCIIEPITGLILCGLVEGVGTDQCDPYGTPDKCWTKIPCSSDAECGAGAKCWEGQCYWKASVPYQEYLDWEGSRTVSVKFEFEKRKVGNQFLGSLEFQLAPWNVGCGPHVRIYLLRNGQRVRTVYDQVHPDMAWTSGDPYIRTDPITFSMAAEAIDGMEFLCRCERGFPYYSWSAVMTKIHCQYLFI